MKSSPEGPVSRAAEVLPLWEVLPQSVASGGSPDGAEKSKQRQAEQTARIMLALAAAGCFADTGRYLSRDEIEARTGIKGSTLCARLGPSGPLRIMGDVSALDGARKSSAGISVIGYQLTYRGAELLKQYASLPLEGAA